MAKEELPRGAIVRPADLPTHFPTHRHDAAFWEALGRVVATFGFLEEILGKAIFSFTGTRAYPEEELEAEFERWLPSLQRALSDPLGNLIDSYGRAVRAHPDATITDLDELLADLRTAATYRNVLCHGSWRSPDTEGRAVPLFVNKKNEIWTGAFDQALLQQVQANAVELICAVMTSVADMGWQFPGSAGPGKPIALAKRSG